MLLSYFAAILYYFISLKFLIQNQGLKIFMKLSERAKMYYIGFVKMYTDKPIYSYFDKLSMKKFVYFLDSILTDVRKTQHVFLPKQKCYASVLPPA